jgi:amino acid transporter
MIFFGFFDSSPYIADDSKPTHDLESSAMYGEESKNPKKIIPLATLLGVIGIGVFYAHP